MLRELGLGIAIFALIFLSACIDYEDEALKEQYKQKCLDLTSYDWGYIPKCASHEECLALVEKNLFDFSDLELSLQSRQILYSYKAHLAKSWLHYNEAMRYIKEIRKACSEKDFESALENANDFRYFIEKAFAESDNALNASIGFILYEKKNLEDQNIELMKEEPMYAFYVKLSDNARQIFSEKYLGLNNYSSNLRRLAEEISSMRSFAGAKPKIIKRKTLAELFIWLLPMPLDDYFSKNEDAIYVPIFLEAINKYVDLAVEYSTTQRLLIFLSEERPDEFFKLLSELTGTKSSLASDFSALAKQDCLQRIFLNEELAQLEETLVEKIKSAEKKAEFFSNDAFAYADENFLLNLQVLLSKPLAFSFEHQTFSSLADASANARPKISGISKAFSELKSNVASGRATLGLRTSKLKELNIQISQIISSLEKLEGSLNVLIDACNSEILSSPKDSELAFLAEKYKQATQADKLVFCSEFIKIKASKKALELQREENEAMLKEMDCSRKLSILISFVKSDSLIEKYKKLIDSNNIAFECTSLLSAVEQDIRKNYDIERINALFNEISKYYYFLEKFANERNLKFYEMRAYFDAKGLVLEKAMPSINTLTWNITKLHSELLEKASSFLSEYAKEHYLITAFPLQELELSNNVEKSIDARFILSFENPFFDFEHNLSIDFPFLASNCTLISQSPNIANVTFSNKAIRLDLNMMPKGRSYVEFSCTKNFVLSLASQEVALNSDFGIISEKYRVETDTMLPSAKLNFLYHEGTAKLVFHGKEIPLVREAEYFVAHLQDIQPNDVILVNYFIEQPLRIELTKISEQIKPDENLAMFSYLCTVQNLTRFDSKNSFFIAPIFAGHSVEVLDERGKKVSNQNDARGLKIVLDSIGAYGKRAFYIKFTIADLNAYKAEMSESIREILSTVSHSDELKQEADEIRATLENNKNDVQKLQKLYEKALELKSKDDAKKRLYDQYNFLRSALQNAINDSNDALKNASSIQLYDFAEIIKNKIYDASKTLAEAEVLFKSDPSKAISLLESAITSLQSFNASTGADIKEKVAKLIDAANKIGKSLNDVGLKDSNSTAMLSNAYALQEQILSELSKGELPKASQTLALLEHEVDDLNKYSMQLIDNEIEKLAQTLDFVIEISKTYDKRIGDLKAQLKNVSKELLIEARYLPEFDEAMLDEIAKSLSISKDALWLEAEQMLSERLYVDALKFARAKKLNEKASKIKEANAKLTSIENSLKSSASHYIELLEKEGQNQERLQNIIYAAKKKYAGKEYLSALVTAKIGLASLEKKNQNMEIYGIFFVLTLIAALYFVKNFHKKKEIQRPQRVLKGFKY